MQETTESRTHWGRKREEEESTFIPRLVRAPREKGRIEIVPVSALGLLTSSITGSAGKGGKLKSSSSS